MSYVIALVWVLAPPRAGPAQATSSRAWRSPVAIHVGVATLAAAPIATELEWVAVVAAEVAMVATVPELAVVATEVAMVSTVPELAVVATEVARVATDSELAVVATEVARVATDPELAVDQPPEVATSAALATLISDSLYTFACTIRWELSSFLWQVAFAILQR